MKKAWKYFLILITMNVSAQNLVPNPSFEDTAHCPDHFGNIDQAAGWINCGFTPDYYNSCANSQHPAYGVPDGGYSGFQYALDGNAYVGFVTYSYPVVQHEFIGVQLLQPLTVGVTYFASVYIVRSENYLCATNNFGFRFTTTAQFSEIIMPPIDNFSHIHFNDIITDTLYWQHLSGTFIADSAYQYLILGNFHDNLNTTVFNCDTFISDISYYLIDGVCVSTDSIYNETWIGISNPFYIPEIMVYPNPVTDILSVSFKENNSSKYQHYTVLDYLGKIVQQATVAEDEFEIEVSNLNDGIYILELSGENSAVRKKFVVRHV